MATFLLNLDETGVNGDFALEKYLLFFFSFQWLVFAGISSSNSVMSAILTIVKDLGPPKKQELVKQKTIRKPVKFYCQDIKTTDSIALYTYIYTYSLHLLMRIPDNSFVATSVVIPTRIFSGIGKTRTFLHSGIINLQNNVEERKLEEACVSFSLDLFDIWTLSLMLAPSFVRVCAIEPRRNCLRLMKCLGSTTRLRTADQNASSQDLCFRKILSLNNLQDRRSAHAQADPVFCRVGSGLQMTRSEFLVVWPP